MTVLAFLIPFVLLGAIVVFIAFSGGPSRAREAYLTGGGAFFKVAMLVVYIGAGLAVPALILSGRGEAVGGTGPLRTAELSQKTQQGKALFRQQCSSCHTLAAINARGVTGPNLDDIGEVTSARVRAAIENGGTGQQRMPAGLLRGEEADAVADYVSKVASR